MPGSRFYLNFIAAASVLGSLGACGPAADGSQEAAPPSGQTDARRAEEASDAAPAPLTSTDKRAQLVLDAFAAYNRRDTDALLSYVSEDVNWPNGTTSDPNRRLHGREALRRYWANQWDETRTHDTPTEAEVLPDGRVRIGLDQVVRNLSGEEISRGSFNYYFTLAGDKITRLDIEK